MPDRNMEKYTLEAFICALIFKYKEIKQRKRRFYRSIDENLRETEYVLLCRQAN